MPVWERDVYTAFIRMYNKLRLHEGVILRPALDQMEALEDAVQRENPAMLEVNRAIAQATEQNYKISKLRASGLLDADACAAKLAALDAQLTQLRVKRRRLLRNDDISEVAETLRQTTWARNGKKRIVWRCVSRLEFGTKYCHDSPSMDEDKLHQAILEGINEFVQAGQGLGDELLDLASIVQQGGSADGIDPLTLRNRLDTLTAQQAELLDKVLEDMESEELNAQLKAIMEEKQAILGRLGAIQQDEEQRAGQEARLRELAEWLKQQNGYCTFFF